MRPELAELAGTDKIPYGCGIQTTKNLAKRGIKYSNTYVLRVINGEEDNIDVLNAATDVIAALHRRRLHLKNKQMQYKKDLAKFKEEMELGTLVENSLTVTYNDGKQL